MAEKTKVSREVFKGIEELRKSGRTRMSDVASAIRNLEAMGAYAASDWVQNHYALYEQGLREGFEIE